MSWDTDSDFWIKSAVLATLYTEMEQALKHLPSLVFQVIVLFIDLPVPLPLQDLPM